MDFKKQRFSGAIWFGNNKEVTIGGVGSIGSWVALCLGRIGHSLVLYDDDSVEEVNLAGQFYSTDSINVQKTYAVAALLRNFAGNTKVKHHQKLSATSEVTTVCISAFDNMEARKTMFKLWKEKEDREVFIDGRLTAESFQVYTVVKGLEKEYEDTLFDDDSIPDLPCSFKSTTHTSMHIASVITEQLCNYLSQGIYQVPFLYKVMTPLQLITIE